MKSRFEVYFDRKLFFGLVKRFSWLIGCPFALGIFLLIYVKPGTVLGAGIIGLMSLAVLTPLVISWHVARQLSRLNIKARKLRRLPGRRNSTDPVGDFVASAEWENFERSLNRMGGDLKSKTIRLSREKTELRAIMASMEEGILAIDPQGRVLFYNPQLALMFPFPKNYGANLSLYQLIRDPLVQDTYNRAIHQGVAAIAEIGLKTSDLSPQPMWFRLHVAPLRKKHNQEVYGAVGIFYDITDLKAVEKMRIDFVANVSHELRTPLTSIKGYLQTLVGDFDQGQFASARDFLGIISRNVDRLIDLVADLLDLSHIESGPSMQITVVDLRELTEMALEEVNARDHVIRLSYEVDELSADSKRLAQVLRNLLENAVRYVPRGKLIEVIWRSQPSGSVLLIVKDNGPGIAEPHLARLFERFYRADSARSREVGGTGIGLALVKHIMNAHGGTVRVQSQVGVGTEFVCEFPNVAMKEGLPSGSIAIR